MICKEENSLPLFSVPPQPLPNHGQLSRGGETWLWSSSFRSQLPHRAMVLQRRCQAALSQERVVSWYLIPNWIMAVRFSRILGEWTGLQRPNLHIPSCFSTYCLYLYSDLEVRISDLRPLRDLSERWTETIPNCPKARHSSVVIQLAKSVETLGK